MLAIQTSECTHFVLSKFHEKNKPNGGEFSTYRHYYSNKN